MNVTRQPTSARLVRAWTRFYTYGLDPETSRSRRDEIASDLWEHSRHDASCGIGNALTNVVMIVRMVAGIPADLSWRRRPNNTETSTTGAAMTWSRFRPLAHLATAVLAALFALLAAGGFDRVDPGTGMTVLASTYVVLLISGSVLRRRHPLLSLGMIGLPAGHATLVIWWPLFAITGLTVLVLAVATTRWESVSLPGWSSHDAIERARVMNTRQPQDL